MVCGYLLGVSFSEYFKEINSFINYIDIELTVTSDLAKPTTYIYARILLTASSLSATCSVVCQSYERIESEGKNRKRKNLLGFIIQLSPFAERQKVNMKYKYSIYNIKCMDKKGKSLIYNTYSSALLEIDNSYLNFSEEELEFEENSNSELHEVLLALKDQGIIVPTNVDERERSIYFSNQLRNLFDDFLFLTIAPTYLCNMTCRYCFQIEEYGIINQNTLDDIVSLLDKLLVEKKHLHISWFGGEPLLALKEIEILSNSVIKLCKSHNVLYTSDMITNGVLLSAQNARRLRKCNITSLQITIDGIETQRTNRHRKDGKDSYLSIIENIQSNAELFKIHLRCNLEEQTFEDVKAMLIDILEKRKIVNKLIFHFSPITNYSGYAKDVSFNSYCSSLSFCDGLVELADIICKYQELDTIDNFNLQSSLSPCASSSLNKYAIDYQGNIFKCELAMQSKSGIIGTIRDVLKDENVLYNKQHFMWLNYKLPTHCFDCQLLPICQGGCMWDRMIDKGKCSLNKELYKKVMLKKYQQYLEETR